MLRSSNPILSKKDAFTPAAPQYGTPAGGYGAVPYGQQGYSGYPGGTGYAPAEAPEDRMTFDDVVTKTAITMAILIASAALAWMFVPAPLYFPALILSALVGFGVVLLVAVRRNISPGLVLVYAAIEGVFIGMISKYFETYYEGIVVQAVIGTFAAAGVTLAAYKFFNIRVTPTFRKWVIAAMFGFVALSLMDVVLGLFGASFGFNGFGGMGFVSSLIGLGLGVLMLILDFDYVERGIAAGLPERESWRAAFGLTVTIIWIYIELLRLLAILRGE